MSTSAWAAAFAETAAAYWTEERTHEVTAGKRLPLLPGPAAPVLRAIGLLHRDASMGPREVRKYRQINHMVASLRPGLTELVDTFGAVRLVDAAAGRGYLTLLLGWWLTHELGADVQILGIDRQARLVEPGARRAAMIGLEDRVRFATADLTDVDLGVAWQTTFGTVHDPVVHGLVALHACDGATDLALALGVRSGAHLLAVAPCCQAELSAKWKARAATDPVHPLQAVWGSNSLRRDLAATTTDAMRAALLRAVGFEVRAAEFVGTEHTPKNTLIRAVRRGSADSAAWSAYRKLVEHTGGDALGLEAMLRPWCSPADPGASRCSSSPSC